MRYAQKQEKRSFFSNRDDGFDLRPVAWDISLRPFGVSRATSLPLKGAKTVKMQRPPHNSG